MQERKIGLDKRAELDVGKGHVRTFRQVRLPLTARGCCFRRAIRHRPALGRFGWKANNPSLVQRTAGASNGDMGITTSLRAMSAAQRAAPIGFLQSL